MCSAVSAGHVFDGKIWLDNYGLLLEGGNIQALLPRADIPRDIPHNNLGDLSLAPGLIDTDLGRTVAGVGSKFAREDSAEQNELRQVLEAFAAYRPDFGYVQGLSRAVAHLKIFVSKQLCPTIMISSISGSDFVLIGSFSGKLT